jgi:hypothetical protein
MFVRRGAAGVVLLSVVGLAAGCGGGAAAAATVDAAADTAPTTDVSGWFAVTAYNTGACGMTMPSNLGSPYVWIEHQVNRYVVHACAGTTEADCTGTYFYDFTSPIENGWHASGAIALFSAGCSLTVERTDLTVIGDALHAHALKVQTNEDIPQAQCTIDAAYALTAPCTYEVDMTGTRL